MSESAIELNEKQEMFCQLYTSSKEFFGNGVQAYLEVYDIDQSKPNWYKTACANASRLLSNEKVCLRINEMLESNGLSNEFVDKQTLFLITQHADFGNKLGAIREYNKLKGRITEKYEHGNPAGQTFGVSINAGGGFLPATVQLSTPSARSDAGRQSQIQSSSVASSSPENNDGNK